MLKKTAISLIQQPVKSFKNPKTMKMTFTEMKKVHQIT